METPKKRTILDRINYIAQLEGEIIQYSIFEQAERITRAENVSITVKELKKRSKKKT